MTSRAAGTQVCFAIALMSGPALAQGDDPAPLPTLPAPSAPPPAPPPPSSPPASQPSFIDHDATAVPSAAPPPEPSERTAQNGFYVEGFGPALFYSLNVDHAFGDVVGRVGIGGYASGGSSWIGVPITLSYIGVGSPKNMLEIGGGISLQFFSAGNGALFLNSSGSAVVLGTVIIGYRLQPPKGGFLLRAGVSPLFGAGGFIPWPYVALGAAF